MGTYANFYNSDNGDRIYDAEAFAEWLKPFFKTGVFNNELQVVASSGMNVVVKSGNAYIEGKLKKFDNETVLTLEPASSTVDRIDAIVVRRNDTERDFTIQVIKGSTNAPQPVREGGIYDIVLAHISVPMATTEVTQALITDTRMNADICGWVVSNVEEVDFNQITAQFSDYLARFEADNLQEFTDWFNLIKGQLTTDQAGALWAAIEGVNASIDQINTDVKELQTDMSNVKFGDVCGKNLVDWSKASHKFYNYSDGNITNSINYYGVLEHFETKEQKLTLSFDITSNVTNPWCAITLYDENKNYLRNVNDYAQELSVIPNSNEKYASFALYSTNSSLSKDDYYNVQLEYGDRTSYEPYIPSLKKLNSNIANSGKFYGIDTSNILTSQDGNVGSGGMSYKATQDCYVFVYNNHAGSLGSIYINGVYAMALHQGTCSLVLKNGQTVTVYHGDSGNQIVKLKAFGIKG